MIAFTLLYSGENKELYAVRKDEAIMEKIFREACRYITFNYGASALVITSGESIHEFIKEYHALSKNNKAGSAMYSLEDNVFSNIYSKSHFRMYTLEEYKKNACGLRANLIVCDDVLRPEVKESCTAGNYSIRSV